MHRLSQHGHRVSSLSVKVRISLVCAGLIALAFFAFSGSAQGATEACTTNNQQGTLCVSVTDTPDPVAYSSFDGNVTYLHYDITVTNRGRSSLSHVGLTDTIPDGTSLIGATSARGSCSATGQVVTCPLGALKKGQQVTVEIDVTAPATALADPAPITITNTATGAFDENFNDQTGGKQDTVTNSETTTVSKTASQSFVPKGHSGKVDTDPAKDQYANVSVPNASTDVFARLQLLAPDSFCSADGTVRIANKNYICRQGGFIDASVIDADTKQTYTNSQDKLVFHLRWAPSLVSDRQTERNFVVFYQASGGAGGSVSARGAQAAQEPPVQVFGDTCNASASNAPCVENVNLGADGSLSADFVKDSNGHMR